jgi:hypothetical protein
MKIFPFCALSVNRVKLHGEMMISTKYFSSPFQRISHNNFISEFLILTVVENTMRYRENLIPKLFFQFMEAKESILTKMKNLKDYLTD